MLPCTSCDSGIKLIQEVTTLSQTKKPPATSSLYKHISQQNVTAASKFGVETIAISDGLLLDKSNAILDWIKSHRRPIPIVGT